MIYSRLALVGIFLLSISTFLVCDARPIKSKNSKSKGAKKSFLNILNDQQSDLNCDDILSDKSDLKTFSDEVAMSFFKTGNVAALDHVLESLVKKKCFTEEATKSFRHQLVTVYELINNDQNKKKRSGDSDDDNNNNRRPYSYFDQLNYLVDELVFAYNNGNEDSIDVFKSMVDYILAMEDAKQLKTNQANFLLDKIKDTISQNPRHQQQHHGDIEYEEKASNDLMASRD